MDKTNESLFIDIELAKLAKERGCEIGSDGYFIEYHQDFIYDGDKNHHESYLKGDVKYSTSQFMVNNKKEFGDYSNKYYTMYERFILEELKVWLLYVHDLFVTVVPNVTKDSLGLPKSTNGFQPLIYTRNGVVHTPHYDKIEYQYDIAFRKGLYIALKDYVDITKPIEESVFNRYKDSGLKDIYGASILEGSIINADGYNSEVGLDNDGDEYEKKVFQCVEFNEKDGFYSNIYGDKDPLTRYTRIEVVGHVEDYRDKATMPEWFNSEGEDSWSGNFFLKD